MRRYTDQEWRDICDASGAFDAAEAAATNGPRPGEEWPLGRGAGDAATISAARARLMYKVRAPFLKGGEWRWHTWETHESNKHAAVIAKGNEIDAEGWDFGQTDFYPATNYPGGTF